MKRKATKGRSRTTSQKRAEWTKLLIEAVDGLNPRVDKAALERVVTSARNERIMLEVDGRWFLALCAAWNNLEELR